MDEIKILGEKKLIFGGYTRIYVRSKLPVKGKT